MGQKKNEGSLKSELSEAVIQGDLARLKLLCVNSEMSLSLVNYALTLNSSDSDIEKCLSTTRQIIQLDENIKEFKEGYGRELLKDHKEEAYQVQRFSNELTLLAKQYRRAFFIHESDEKIEKTLHQLEEKMVYAYQNMGRNRGMTRYLNQIMVSITKLLPSNMQAIFKNNKFLFKFAAPIKINESVEDLPPSSLPTKKSGFE